MATQPTVRERLEWYCYVHNPANITKIDTILKTYSGKEEQMFKALATKYGPQPTSDDATRSRLEMFFRHYNPEKLASIGEIMAKFSGPKRADLFPALVNKYGPETFASGGTLASEGSSASLTRQQSAEPVTPSASRASFGNDFRARLVRFMEKYNREKLDSVDTILKAYAGRETEMFEALVKKYGPEPSAAGETPTRPAASASSPEVSTVGRTQSTLSSASAASSDFRQRLIRFMEKYNREKLDSVDTILKAYAGRETEMFEALVKKYGPEPSAAGDDSPSTQVQRTPSQTASSGDDTRGRLIRFCESYCPEKLDNVDKILKAYSGREHEMFDALVKKYGPEPAASPQDDADAVAAFMHANDITADDVLMGFPESDLLLALTKVYGPLVATDTRQRLLQFMEKYNPEKITSIDTILKAYAGREAELFDSLVKKYGPEPIDGGGDGRKDDTAPRGGDRVRQCLLKKGISPLEALYAVFPSKAKLLSYLQDVYGDYEGRLRRLFVRHCPEELESVDELLDNHQGDEDALLRDLVRRLGPEPPRDAPTHIVHMLTKPSSSWRHIEEEDAISDSDADGNTSQVGRKGNEAPAVIKEGHLLVQDSGRAPPGDYSGDEGKAFPGEEEYWLQIAIGGDRETLESASPMEMKRRSYTEFNPEMSDGESGSPMSSASFMRGRSESSFRGSPNNNNSIAAAAPAAAGGAATTPAEVATVHVRSKFGHNIADLCVPCSKKVVSAFDALWQPVGPGHKKVLSSSTTKEGYLEKLSNSRIGAKWQRRFFRVNDKGILYYETNQPNEKPKGYKVLTRRSCVREQLDAASYPKCNDSNFAYFGITCNETNEEFLLRAASADEKASWIAFFREALERVKLSNTGQDPVPARWRARVGGVKLSLSELIIVSEESNSKARSLQAKRDALQRQLEEETSQLDMTKVRTVDLEQQHLQLSATLSELVEQVGAAEESAELKCLTAAEAASHVVLQRDELEKDLEKARENVREMTRAIIDLEKQAVELEHVKNHEHLKLQQVFQKWRNVEQRTPSPSKHSESLSVSRVVAANKGASPSLKALSASP